MKKVMIFSLTTAIVFLSCSTVPEQKEVKPRAEPELIERIIESPRTKDQLYSLSLQWVSESFVSGKTVIDLQDKESGKIIGKGIIGDIDKERNLSSLYDVIFKIDVKENKVRIQINSADARNTFTYNNTSMEMDIHRNEDSLKAFKMYVTRLFDSYSKVISAEEENW